MKKVLFVASVIKIHIMVFHIPYLKWFKENGYEVHVAAANDYENKEDCNIPYCDKLYDISFERSPFKKNNFRAVRNLKNIIDTNEYDLIHCHTPIGGALGRIAARGAREKGTKVIYTAHGFHFFRGSPVKNWLVYYPVEKLLARQTDGLITINEEDYNIAVNNKFKANNIELIEGVGINFKRFQPQTKIKKNMLRDQYGYNKKDFILIYVGELSYRKHQDLLISVATKLKKRIPNLKILLVGTGKLEETYIAQIKKLGVEDQVELLGFRKDIENLMMLSDMAISASRQEGLPVNVMEAMATGLPLVVTDCRGNRDLVSNNENGYVVGIDDMDGFANSIEQIYQNEALRISFGNESLNKVQKYSLQSILKKMEIIYNKVLLCDGDLKTNYEGENQKT